MSLYPTRPLLPTFYLIEILIEFIKLRIAAFFARKAPLHVAILGSKGSGKTTLWNKLRNIACEEQKATDQTEINSFKVCYDGKTITVASTYDIGGDDVYVGQDYELVINNNDTLIYFLTDLMKLQESKDYIGACLKKISLLIKEKKLKRCRVKILATNLQSFKLSGLEEKYGSALKYAKSILGLNRFETMLQGLDKIILPIELTDDAQIELIKSEIIHKTK